MTGEQPPIVEGLRVIEIGDLGEVAGKLLADAGADVIRVEPPGGTPTRALAPFVADEAGPERSLRFIAYNTSKRGITLDVSTDEGRALWWRLVASADVVIDGAGHGVLDGLGAGFESCAEHEGAEGLVWCSITPFGREGPWADWTANDLVQIALGGPMMSTGYDDHELPPIHPGYDHSLWMGGEYAVCGVLAAVLAMEAGTVSGPELVDLSIHEAVSCTTEGAFPNWEYRRELVQRQTGRHSAPQPTPAWQFPTADGRFVNVIGGGLPRNPRSLEGLLDWMDEHGAAEGLREPRYRDAVFSSPSDPLPERAEFGAAVQRFIAGLTAEEAYRRGQDLHMPWSVVRRPEENLDDPHWDDRDFFDELEVPGYPTPVRAPTAPYRFGDASVRMRRRAPLIGEHNHEVYVGELSLDGDELPRLAQAGVI